MKKACVVKAHRAGLFSLINKIITCAEIYENVHVDLSGSLYGEGNVWDALFEPTTPPEEPYDVIETYPHQDYTYRGPALLYTDPSDAWRHRLHALWLRFKVRPEVMYWADAFTNNVGPYVSVQILSLAHAGEQITGESQAMERYEETLWATLRPGESVFPLVNDVETRKWLAYRFPISEITNARRAANRYVDFHLSCPQTFEDAKEALIEVLIASRARAICHPISNMATAALYMNPELESIYLP